MKQPTRGLYELQEQHISLDRFMEQGRCQNVWLVVYGCVLWLCVVPLTVDFVMFVYMWLC